MMMAQLMLTTLYRLLYYYWVFVKEMRDMRAGID